MTDGTTHLGRLRARLGATGAAMTSGAGATASVNGGNTGSAIA